MHTVPKLKSYSAAALDKAVEKLRAALSEEAKAVKSEAEWKTFRDRWIGRKSGVLTQINDLWLKAAPKDSKREVGQRVNEIRTLVEDIVSKAEKFSPRFRRDRRPDHRLTASISPSPAFAARSARNIP